MSHRIEPSKDELEEAKNIVDSALSSASKELPMNQEVKVGLGWTEKEFVLEKMNGASGYAKYPNVLDIDFNNSANNWRESLRATSFHEYAHVWDYEQRGKKWEKRWQYILGEALAQHFANQNSDYRARWRTEHSREKIAEYWPKIRDKEISKDMEEASVNGSDPLFINKGEGDYPNWLGYSLAWQIGKALLKNHKLEDFPEITKQQLTEAGNKIYLQK